MVIQHNLASMNANRQLGVNTGNKSKTAERLSSGFRINRAADDAAGLAVSESLRWSIRGLNQASRNIQDGVSLTQVADGGMSEIQNILQRQRELSVQAANDTNTAADRNAIQQEINELSAEITQIANNTTFNGLQILNHEGNLTLGPVTNENAVTTLLGIPGSNSTGVLTGFMATNQAGSIQSQLLYGGNMATTSPFIAKITIGTPPRNYMVQSGSPLANCTVTNANITDGINTTFAYDDGAGTKFSVIRTITKMPNPTGTGEVYKMDFSIKNDTAEAMSVDLEIGMDVMFEGNDNPSFVMDGNNHETVITNPVKYNPADMPGVMNLFDPNNPYLNVQCIVKGDSANIPNEPDYMKIGAFGSIMGDSWTNNPIYDSMYTVGWNNITIAAGAASGNFNTMYGVSDPLLNPVLSGNHSTPIVIKIQASDQAYTSIGIPLVDCTSEKLGVDNLSVGSHADAGVTLRKIDKAIEKVSEHRSGMGAIYNRLEKAGNNVNNTGENLQASESRIRDADMAKEMADYAKHDILVQSGQSMLAQAGKINEGVLQLLQ